MKIVKLVAAVIEGGLKELNKTSPLITPVTTGGEVSTNGGFEGAYVAGLAPNWNKSGTPTLAQSADAHGGVAAQSFTGTAANNRIEQQKGSNNVWYQLTCFGKRTAGATGDVFLGVNDGGADSYGPTYTDAAYTQKLLTFLCRTSGRNIRPAMTAAASGYDTVLVDDLSLKALDFSSLMTYLGQRGSQSGTYICKPTVARGTQVGLIVNYTDINNFVMFYLTHTRTNNAVNVCLAKCVAGVYTFPFAPASSGGYIPGAELKLVVDGTLYRLYYNGVQMGTDTTINDVGAGTKVFGFSTFATNEVGQVTTKSDHAWIIGGAAPGVTVQFDDAKASTYSEAFSYMGAAGIKGTAFVITNNLDVAGSLTSAQVQEMNAAGWDIANHTTDHAGLGGASQATLSAKTQGAEAALNALGCTRASKHVAYPNGVYDTNTATYMQVAGMLSGRTIEANDVSPHQNNLYLYPCRMIVNTQTLADVQALVTTGVGQGKIVNILFHDLVAAGPTTYEWTIANFRAFIDWLVAQGIPTYTVTEMYAMR